MERRLEAEAAILTNLGHEVLYSGARFPGSERWHTEMEAAGARRVKWRPYKFVERRHLWSPVVFGAMVAASSIRSEQLDLAHIAVPYGYVGMSMACVLRRAGIPCVLGIHAKLSDRPLDAAGTRTVRRGLERLAGMYAVSEPALQSFRELYSGLLPTDCPMRVVHNGIDLERFRVAPSARAEVREELGLKSTDFVVVFCGRLDTMKRPLLALQSFERLYALNANARFLVVGDGPERAELEGKIAGAGMKDVVRMVGWVKDPPRYYVASDCYLSTSNNQEGCPLATAEALATGLVAVVPRDDVFGSVYGNTTAVQFAEPKEPSKVAAALHALLALPEENRMALGRAGRLFVEQNLSFELMSRYIKEFYRAVESRI